MAEWDWTPYAVGGATRPDTFTGLQPDFSSALQTMFANAPPEIKAELLVTSGYRSPEKQAQLWADALDKYGSPAAARKWVAPPGSSQHNHGNAADLKFVSDAAKAWVHQNAANYGLAFPLSNEPWHIELASARGRAPNTAVAAINSAAPSAVMKPATKPGGIMGGIGHALMGGVNSLQATANQALPGIQAKTAQVTPDAIMKALSTVQGRTAIGKYLMNKNISKAPEAVAGNVMGGSPVMAVNNQGRNPMTLMSSGTQSGGTRSYGFDQKYHGNQNMDIYRANRAAIGDRITQANINQALMRGSTLYSRRDPDEGTPQSLVG